MDNKNISGIQIEYSVTEKKTLDKTKPIEVRGYGERVDLDVLAGSMLYGYTKIAKEMIKKHDEFCNDKDCLTKKVHENILQQIELIVKTTVFLEKK